MNKVIISGRLTMPPNVTTSSNDTKVAKFTVAVDRRRRGPDGQSTADFLRVTCFGNQAGFIEQYIEQGDMVSVVGRIETGSYTNKEGVKVYTTEIMGESVELLRKHAKPKDAESAKQGYRPVNVDDFEEMDDDELPFN